MHTEGIDASPKPRQRRFERGEGRLKGILIVVIVALAIYSAWKVVPVYVNEYQLSDKMQEQARYAVVNRYTRTRYATIFSKLYRTWIFPRSGKTSKWFPTTPW